MYSVHPHACGERSAKLAPSLNVIGSPPRLWGTPVESLWYCSSGRFTPTPVGNASGTWASRQHGTVHPHACGERQIAKEELWTLNGSPPRLWGTRRVLIIFSGVSRFTPTPVGNAVLTGKVTLSAAVHPHACGERSRVARAAWSLRGSPPRLWGTQLDRAEPRWAARFTPTPVGNAPSRSGGQPRPAVHPHACGEREDQGSLRLAHHGSPPRLWGTL